MPWKASSVMEERLRFVARLIDGESMSDVCRDFGISRKTGYKIYSRYRGARLVRADQRVAASAAFMEPSLREHQLPGGEAGCNVGDDGGGRRCRSPCRNRRG
jgi:transposase-like protein